MAVLIVDDDCSFCGECGRGAIPAEKRHSKVAWPDDVGAPGCGVEWTELATHLRFVPWTQKPVDDHIRRVRPDLPYIGHVPWDWKSGRFDA